MGDRLLGAGPNRRAFLIHVLVGIGGIIASVTDAKVARVGIDELVKNSDVIALVVVKSVSADSLGGQWAIAQVIEQFKGPKLTEVSYFAGKTWECDIAEAIPEERVLLFLARRDGDYRYWIAHAGRGRMPIRVIEKVEYASFWTDVTMPRAVVTAADPVEEYDFIRVVRLSELTRLIKASLR